MSLNPLMWVKSIFSNGDVVGDIFDKDDGILVKSGGWVNGLNYSDAEKATDDIKLIAAHAEFVKSTLEENTIRSKTRRAIAMSWIRVQLFLVLLTVVIAPYDLTVAKFYLELTTSWLMVSGTLSVIGFFFGTHLLRARGKIT